MNELTPFPVPSRPIVIVKSDEAVCSWFVRSQLSWDIADRAENLGQILRHRDATIGGDNSGGSNDVRAQRLTIRIPTRSLSENSPLADVSPC
jgi:hypothetical protein